MNRKKLIVLLISVFAVTSFTGCGKEDGTKYEYADNVIYEENESSIKLLNSTETEEELKLNFAMENFEAGDVTVKVYDAEENEITENIECSYDGEKNSVSIKGDVSGVSMAEVNLNESTNLKVKDLKNEEFKFLLTSKAEKNGCIYLGDLDDFQVKEDDESESSGGDGEGILADGEEGAAGEDGTGSGRSSGKVRMTKAEIYDLLKGTWKSDDGSFTIVFSDGSGEKPYNVKASGTEEFESGVSYFDETKTEEGHHKIRFVTSTGEYGGNCRDIILSSDGDTLSYILDSTVNEDGETEYTMIKCHK
jgi:hypothetical protein